MSQTRCPGPHGATRSQFSPRRQAALGEQTTAFPLLTTWGVKDGGGKNQLNPVFLLYFEKNISVFQHAFPCLALARLVGCRSKPPPAVAPRGCRWPQGCGFSHQPPWPSPAGSSHAAWRCANINFPLLLTALKLRALLQKSKNTLILNTASADKATGAGNSAESRVSVRVAVLFPVFFLLHGGAQGARSILHPFAFAQIKPWAKECWYRAALCKHQLRQGRTRNTWDFSPAARHRRFIFSIFFKKRKKKSSLEISALGRGGSVQGGNCQ